MHYTTLFFDLDGTLYSNRTGLWEAIRDRMNQYMAERLALPAYEIPILRHDYYETYGTTLRGLQIHYNVDTDDYLSYVHDLPLEEYIQPEPDLHKLLSSLSQDIWIFTNADADHAQRVLAVMGLTDCFKGVIDVRAIEFACKPEKIAYQRALAIAGNPHVESCILLDDSGDNLAAARQIGFTTVYVNHNGDTHPNADYTLTDLLELPRVVPVLWE